MKGLVLRTPTRSGLSGKFFRDNLSALILLGFTLYLVASQLILHLTVAQAIGLLFAGASVLLIILRPILGFYSLVAVFSSEHVLGFSELFTATKALGGLVFFAWALEAMLGRRYRLPRTWILAWGPIFLFWSLISLAGAENVAAGLHKLSTIVQLNLLVIVAATILRSRKDLEGLLWTILGSTLFSTLYGVASVARGAQTNLEGLAGNRNAVGLFIAMSAPIIFYFYPRVSMWKRAGLMASAALLLVGEALSYSRGGVIVLTVSILLSIFIMMPQARWRLALQVGIVGAGVGFVMPETFWGRIATIVPAITQGTDTMGLRYRLWEVSLRMIAEYPVLGVGPGNYLDYFMRYGGILGLVGTPLTSHNAYLSVTAELGIPGGILFVTLFGFTLWGFIRCIRNTRAHGRAGMHDIAATFGIGLFAILLGGTKGTVTYMKYLWLLIGISAAVLALSRDVLDDASSETAATPGPELGGTRGEAGHPARP